LGIHGSHPSACQLHPLYLSDTFAQTLPQAVPVLSGRRNILLTERRLLRILASFLERVQGAFPDAPVLSFLGGERYKTRAAKARLEDALLAMGADRNSLLVAVGGGIVTDLVGFTAATYMRGVPWIAVPTTLLGMVDAALGGKTAVDTPRGKNIVGAFHPPAAVFIALDALDTLPGVQFRCGLAECLKHGLFLDAAYFKWLSTQDPTRIRRDPAALRRLVATSVSLKCAVVDEDPQEKTGRRNILNAGHTVGHALERLSSYRMHHGEAVAAGLLWEAAVAVAQGHLAKTELFPVREALGRLDFPSAWRAVSPEAVYESAGADKKNRAGAVAYVPLGAIGRPALPPPHTAVLTLDTLKAGFELLEKV